MNTYEGVCRFCGETEILMAESQEEADDQVTRQCRCKGWKKVKRSEEIEQTIWKLCAENWVCNFPKVDDETTILIANTAVAVNDGQIEKATFSVAGTTITMQPSGDRVKVVRQAKTEKSEEA